MYMIFILNDISTRESTISGRILADILLSNKIWIFNKNTPNLRKMNQGDKVLVYIAGKGNRYFFASFELGDNQANKSIISIDKLKSADNIEKPLLTHIFKMFDLQWPIKNIQIWDKPVDISSIKDDLEFIIDKKNWGLFFRQSTKVILEDDFNRILQKHKN